MKKQPEPHMLTRRILAARWEKSTMSLKRMEKSGQLPFLKLGRDVRYRPEDIERIEREAMVSR
ncbi:MAG: hypothetical protein WC003_14835 [Terrimicrobiaceae bacterium]|nr:hypothetical protein [Terrimicrobiaceae bacterium]